MVNFQSLSGIDKIVWGSILFVLSIAILWGGLSLFNEEILDQSLTETLREETNDVLGFASQSDKGLTAISSLFIVASTAAAFLFTRSTKPTFFVFIIITSLFALIGWLPTAFIIGFVIVASIVVTMTIKEMFT